MSLNRPIKIIYVIYKFTADGSSIALLNLLDGLTVHAVSPLIVMSKRGSLCSELEKRNIPYFVIRYHLARHYKFYNLLISSILFIPLSCYLQILNFIATKAIVKIARNFKADIIHTNIGPLHIGNDAAKKIGIPHIWHIREYQGGKLGIKPFPSFRKFKERLQTSYAIAISRGIYDHYSLADKANVIYDGVLNASESQFSPEKGKYFLFVGQLQESKGIEELISAFIEFSKLNSEYELYIAGWGKDSYVLKLKAEIINANLGRKTFFLGPRKDVFPLMAKASAVIMSSLIEGFGFVTAEAMFNGCLVIGYNTTGTKEQFDNGFNRYKQEIAIRYSSKAELVSAMYQVADNGPESFFPMIMRAQKTVCALYSKQRHADEVYEFYKEILNIDIVSENDFSLSGYI